MNTPALRVDIWSDFVCPFCFIGALRLEQLAQQRPLDFHWHAFQLRPAGSPPMDAAKRKMIAEHTPKLTAQMREEFGLALGDGALCCVEVDRDFAADVAQAAQYGFHGVPAIVFGQKYYVSGAQPLAVFAQAAEKAAAESAL